MPVGAVPFPFGLCRICKDKATGVHYGVATCEGCKGFFKRSINKADKYRCFFGGECDINPKNRNRCKSCRYRKCLETGMSVEAVKMGRIPKVEKEKALEALQATHGADPTENEQDADLQESEPGCSSNTVTNLADKNGNHFSSSNILHRQPSATVASQAMATANHIKESYDYHFEAWQRQASGDMDNGSQIRRFGGQDKSGSDMLFRYPAVPDWSQPGGHSKHLPLKQEPGQHQHMSYTDSYNSPDSQQAQVSIETNSHPSQEHIPLSRGPEYIEKPTVNAGLKPGTSGRHQVSVPMVTGDRQRSFFNDSCVQEQNYDKMEMDNSKVTGQCVPVPRPFEHVSTGESTPYFNGGQTFYSAQSRGQAPAQVDYGHPNQYQPAFSTSQSNVYGPAQSGPEVAAGKEPVADFSGAYHSMPMSVVTKQKKLPENPLLWPKTDSTTRSSPMLRSVSRSGLSNAPSSNDGSTTSSQRNPYSPALIKVLIEQVVDTLGGQDIVKKLAQRLQQNNVDKKMVANIMDIIRRAGGTGSESNVDKPSDVTSVDSTYPDSQVMQDGSLSEGQSHISSSRAEDLKTKMENINRFLKDIDHYANSGACDNEDLPMHDDQTEMKDWGVPAAQHSGLQGNPVPGDNGFKLKPCHAEWRYSLELASSNQSLANSKDVGHLNMAAHLNTPSDENNSCSSATRSPVDSSMCQQTLDLTLHPDKRSSQDSHYSTCSGNVSNSTSFRSCDQQFSGVMETLEEEDGCPPGKKQKTRSVLETTAVIYSAMKLMYDWIEEKREALRQWRHGMLQLRETTDSEEDVKVAFTKIIANMPDLNNRILGFCERVPGFTDLDMEDQEELMKRAYYDIWMLTSAEFFMRDGKVTLILPDNLIYARPTMEKIVNKEIVETLFEFADQLNALGLLDVEICVLCTVQLTNADNVTLVNKEAVTTLHSHMLDVLVSEVTKNHPDNHSRLLIDIFRLMPLLDKVNKLQQDFIAELPLDAPDVQQDMTIMEGSEQPG